MRLTLALIAVIASSSAATAAVGPANAQLAAPAQVLAVVTGSAGMWRCDGTVCAGKANAALNQAVTTCADIAGAAGRVAAFTVADYTFTEADLTRCNRRVKP